jgi:hypothetical protein
MQGKNIVVVIDNVPHNIGESHLGYAKIKDAIRAQDWEAVRELVNPVKVVLNYGKGNVSVKGDTLFWKGEQMHNALSDRMITMLTEGFDIEPLVLFMENLQSNPSKRAVDELYGFLEKNSLPITADGHFLAYKKVRKDFRDIHSGTFDNSVGRVLTMERNKVDDNKDQTCSTGLHFCSREYLDHFGGKDDPIVIVKINPRDVVSIPVDYNNSKGRTCRYEVIGLLGVNAEDAFTAPVQENAVGNPAPVKFNLDNPGFVASAPAKRGSLVMSVDDAAQKLGINSSALRKRANRGVSVQWVHYGKTVRIAQ